MSKLTQKDIDKLAKLADLSLSDSDKKEITPQLSDIVSFFDQLNEVRTDKVEPTSQTTGLTNVMRSDKINTTRILSAEEAVSNAHSYKNNYFAVNAVLDKNKDKS